MDRCANSPTALAIYMPAGALLAAALLAGWLAYRAKIAEFRQRWINDLREDIADLLALASQYHRTRDRIYPPVDDSPASNPSGRDIESLNDDTSQDETALRSLEHKMDPIYNRIELRINPQENLNQCQDRAFLKSLQVLLRSSHARKSDPEWSAKLETAMVEARELLKREWDVTKTFCPPIYPSACLKFNVAPDYDGQRPECEVLRIRNHGCSAGLRVPKLKMTSSLFARVAATCSRDRSAVSAAARSV